ncbi:MAG TPA: SMC-Scp complex subunit ScpB [Sporosarcina sp.]|nr:SMC-Scp complex subunit ScpB [Sporosarcina sp.]
MHEQLAAMIESLLFVAGDEGLTMKQLQTIVEQEEALIEEVLKTMQARYEEETVRGFTLKQYGGAYRLVTKAAFAEAIQELLENPTPQTMTKASLEVLAIIAYKQPVTRVEIDDLRGVKSEGPLQTLVSRGFIMEKGRSDGAGRAILYGTTELFLDRFGLASLDQLPPLATDPEQIEDGETDLFMTQFQEAFSFEDEGGATH